VRHRVDLILNAEGFVINAEGFVINAEGVCHLPSAAFAHNAEGVG
jgi:hypothetical protein